MAKVISYTQADGSVAIVIPTGELPLSAVLDKDVPMDALNVSVIDAEEIPKDRTFRNAWTQTESGVAVDMPKAREIHMAKIRTLRNAELEKLDGEWVKNSSQKKTAELAALEAKQKALRDIPQTIDLESAKTPEELKAMWPEELK